MQLHRVAKERGEDRTLVVEAGQVVCPRQGLVDLERCWICPAYGGLSMGHIEGVVCRADPSDPRLSPTPAVR